ncbi:CobW family GTP-binding protein [Alicyclobacillus suci]|uniref:CobW family GTP-binding protein n=1 Tax=Alicyclobacillus suci TaxID=2816080 RepID=UPI001A8FF81D|nr:GTP-binding protein [Alicyclobacillus suci]
MVLMLNDYGAMPVIQTFFAEPTIYQSFDLDAAVTVVDAKHARQHLDETHEAQEQVAFADLLLLNKVDLVSPQEIGILKRRLRAMNPHAKIYSTQKSKIDVEKILDVRAFDIEKKLEIDPEFLKEEAHEHDDSVSSIVLRETRPLALDKVDDWVFHWLSEKGTDVFRYKGILYIQGMKQRMV